MTGAERNAADSQDDALSPAEAAWPFNPDSPHVDGVARPEAPLKILLVDVTGLDWAEIAERLPVALDAATEKGMVPIVLIDLTEFSGLRAAGVVFDVLPNAAALEPLAQDLDWGSYIRRRRALIDEKWRPSATVRLGRRDAEDAA